MQDLLWNMESLRDQKNFSPNKIRIENTLDLDLDLDLSFVHAQQGTKALLEKSFWLALLRYWEQNTIECLSISAVEVASSLDKISAKIGLFYFSLFAVYFLKDDTIKFALQVELIENTKVEVILT